MFAAVLALKKTIAQNEKQTTAPRVHRPVVLSNAGLVIIINNRRLVTLAEHTSDHGRQTNSSTEEKGEQV